MVASSRLSDTDDLSALLDSIQVKTVASLPRAELVRRLSVFASWCGVAMVLVGGATAIGWAVGAYDVTRVATGLASMKLSTATCVVVLGVAILAKGVRRPAARRAAAILAVVVGVIATVSLAQYALGTTYPIDNWFGLDPGSGRDPAGRMSVATAAGLLLLAVALLLGRRQKYWASQLAATVCGVIAGTTLVGYAYGADSLYDIGAFRSIAVSTAASLLLGSLGVVLRHGDQGFVSLLSGNTAGGIIVRRFLPISIVLPIIAGGVVVHVQPDDVIASTAGLIAIAASLVGVTSGALVWVQASRLRSIDLRRAGAEDAFAIAREALRAQESAERRTRAIISASAAGYLAFDLSGIVTDANDAAASIFGQPPEAIVGRRLDSLVSRSAPVEGTEGRSPLRRYLDGDGPQPADRRYEATAVAHDGRRMTLDIILWSVPDDQDGLSFHLFLSDITGRKQAEVELQRANDDLTDFSAAMAHDLRTPLTVVKGFSGLLRSRVEGSDEAQWVDRISSAADRGSRLIDDILTFAQVGRQALEYTPVALDPLARRVAAEQVGAGTRDSRVVVEPLPDVTGDASLLETLLSNLVGNALKYVPADRDPVVVVDLVDDPETGCPVLRVADNGDPITGGERIFDLFQRGAVTDTAVGSGVGLAVCRRIAEVHGGRIWLEVSEAGGPRFCVLIGDKAPTPAHA